MGDILIKLHQDSLFCTVINMFYNQRVYDQEKKSIYIYRYSKLSENKEL